MEEEPAPKQSPQELDQTVLLQNHQVMVKEKIDQVLTAVFYLVLIRSLASLSICFSTILISEYNAKGLLVFPIVVGEGASIFLYVVLAKPKWKASKTRLYDFSKVMESAIVTAMCLLGKSFRPYLIMGYLVIAILTFQLTFSTMLNAINETFLIKLVTFS